MRNFPIIDDEDNPVVPESSSEPFMYSDFYQATTANVLYQILKVLKSIDAKLDSIDQSTDAMYRNMFDDWMERHNT